jgi:hypothetical protein
MAATMVNVFGWMGWELEVDNHIKTRLIFAVADEKLKRLAWYFYSQAMGSGKYGAAWQAEFDKIDMEERKWNNKTDQFTFFGVLDSNFKTGYPSSFPTANIASLAVPLKTGFSSDTRPYASLQPIADDPQGGLGGMECRLEMMNLDVQYVYLRFRFGATRWDRRGFNLQKQGYLWLLKVEPFSLAAVKRGIRGPQDVDGNVDPHRAMW